MKNVGDFQEQIQMRMSYSIPCLPQLSPSTSLRPPCLGARFMEKDQDQGMSIKTEFTRDNFIHRNPQI